jgi:hypothetical protein
MLYMFKGWVEEVGDDVCWLHMRDMTDPSYPDEIWTVERQHLPTDVYDGTYVTFTISGDGDDVKGVFTLEDVGTWSAEDIAKIEQRAKEWSKLFGYIQPTEGISSAD